MTDFTTDRDRLCRILCLTRGIVGMSQEQIAAELSVARKTVQNWEKGTSAPSIDQVIRWFEVLGVSPLKYLFEYVYPSMTAGGDSDSDSEVERLRERLMLMLADIPEEGLRQLLYLFGGEHGSSPRAVMNLMNAHLQTPMRDRVSHGAVIMKNYEIASRRGELSDVSAIQPDMDLLQEALDRGEKAVYADAKAYVIKE